MGADNKEGVVDMIIDFHAHIYPEKIAEKASKAIGHFYEDSPMAYSGRAEELISSGQKIGVTQYVVHSAATTEAQVESVNNFIIEQCALHSEFVGFGTMHPDYKNYEAELQRIREAGLKGIKIHSDFQKFCVDDKKMDDIYDVVSSLNMAALFHAGDYRYDFSGPKRIANVLQKHPKLTVIAAHFGGYTEWDNAIEFLVGKNVYFDTSSSLWKLSVEKANEMIMAHGYNKFLFGSDFPMWDHSDELKRFNTLLLSPSEREAILYGNAHSLLERLGK